MTNPDNTITTRVCYEHGVVTSVPVRYCPVTGHSLEVVNMDWGDYYAARWAFENVVQELQYNFDMWTGEPRVE